MHNALDDYNTEFGEISKKRAIEIPNQIHIKELF